MKFAIALTFFALSTVALATPFHTGSNLICQAGTPNSDLFFVSEFDGFGGTKAPTVQLYFHGVKQGQAECQTWSGNTPPPSFLTYTCRIDDSKTAPSAQYVVNLYELSGKNYSGVSHDNNGFNSLEVMSKECIQVWPK